MHYGVALRIRGSDVMEDVATVFSDISVKLLLKVGVGEKNEPNFENNFYSVNFVKKDFILSHMRYRKSTKSTHKSQYRVINSPFPGIILMI